MKILLTAYLWAVILLSCSGGDALADPALEKVLLPPEKPLLIGLIPEQNLFRQVDRYEPLARYLSMKTGSRIQLKVLSRYGNILHHFTEEGMQGAFFGSFTYALAHAKLNVEVLARPQLPDGQSTYHGFIFVRRQSGIKTPAGMKGKVFAFVDQATTAGFLLPLVYFKEHGIKNYKTFFRETYFAGTHEDVIDDVLNGKADIGAAKNTAFKRWTGPDRRMGQDVAILARSPDVPENGFAVRRHLAPGLKKKLRETLLRMHTESEGQGVLKKFGAQKFIETSDEDYAPVYRYAREIRLNLAAYDYLNE